LAQEITRGALLKNVTALKSVVVGVIIGASTVSLRAATPVETIREFGLIGTWSSDCAVPTGTLGASRLTFEPSENGLATSTSTFSIPIPQPNSQGTRSYPEAISVFQIDTAAVLSDTKVKLTGKVAKLSRSDGQASPPPDAAPREMTVEKANGQIRVVDNRTADGTAIAVEDGVVRATGKPTPFLSRCQTVGDSSRS
jgi:hypothetical protein